MPVLAFNTRHLAWLMGGKLGLAELARGLSPGFWGAGPWLPAAAVVGVTWLVAGGLRRSTLFNTVCVVTAVVVLIFYARVGLSGERPDGGAVRFDRVAETAALFFVAFTGYGRIATLGEEVSDPRRTIPRAVVITLSLCLILYVAVAEASRSMLGVMTSFELDGNPVVTALQFSPFEASSGRVIARIAALSAAASLLGVILNLVLGLSRVVLAMARRGDLPGYFAHVDAKTGSPKRAVWAVGGLVALLTLIGSIKTAWTFSAFTELVASVRGFALAGIRLAHLSRRIDAYGVLDRLEAGGEAARRDLHASL
ncbi:MAG: APC family permease, partial [Planctomycetota bacterium]